MLEVIDKGPGGDSRKTPLLFVHGAWHGAWCWDEHFLDFFAAKGYRSVAVSLRGHGKSPAPRPMQFCSMADMVDDVASVADGLPRRPVVIGHSMGGFVVQKYLESHDAPAAILLASVPPSGIARFLLRRFRLHPWLTARHLAITKSVGSMGGTPEMARESFFSDVTPYADAARYAAGLDEEYVGKHVLDMLLLDLPKPTRITTPVLVLGAEQDILFSPREVRATAAAYRTQAEFIPGMAHDMMLEPGWADVAERIHAWLETRCPTTLPK
ncbi:alpha/beta hydrolase [Mycobacterium sp. 852002-50816_SCH5313054-b]|uniref:alpha/beta hydrolase n=1 Tax=Mycobacterium sp. 852002-50816_SCH5313054-b TaxID=1834092 RepID=UPI0007FC49EF|nr:alpha/beta fold hydrolase [Mycobacterium sp. 852002-50816_SCH5313054-b]OBF63626.1 alpha/beta hydrolase [Mycobacterium sp. 852002-50816_SCH5313054-b]